MSDPRKVFKVKAERRGGHWYVGVFSGQSIDHTFAKNGELVMDDDDVIEFFKIMRPAAVSFEAVRHD